MRLKQVNVDNELKKVQGKGIHNKKVKTLLVMGVVSLVVVIGSSFAAYSSDNLVTAFTSTINKKVTITLSVENGNISGSNIKEGKYNENITFQVTPNSGYVYESNTCPNASYNKETNILTTKTTSSVSCNIKFKQQLLKDAILTNNTLQTAIPNFLKGEPPASGSNTGSGLYKAEDDDGDSYYFRGAVNNNYVQIGTYNSDLNAYELYRNGESTPYDIYYNYDKIIDECNNNYYTDYGYDTADECLENISYDPLASAGDPITWRVVRINGDGTIRLITEEIVDQDPFNTSQAGHKYAGYTYDNDHVCTKANPCTSNSGTSSAIKVYLENWYDNSTDLKLNSNLALGKYCADTTHTISGNTYYYNAYNRLENQGAPSLKCSDTGESYGGNYKLKIGLLTADEMNMTGSCHEFPYATSTNYLYKCGTWYSWTISPSFSGTNSANIFTGGCGHLSYWSADWGSNTIRPVINLKSDVKIISGDGTKDSPYVIE